MATKRRSTKKRQLLAHKGTISRWEVHVFSHGAWGRNYEERVGRAGINARGDFEGALNGITSFDILLVRRPLKELQADDRVGWVLSVKTEISGIVDLTEDEFDVALALATLGRPVHLHMAFDQPRYGSGAIRSFSISTDPME
ncbi:hypothetical protein [Variovorax sp. JS1663]|uniref:hypothetical protein n=1 Tax=Variovorax sp. JS1663 TaxID=1851577 RepID=UPI000B34728E|nr:hypothetical protein [Variovorax sp. JS1663]OUM01734.1 hypothetical protein A8M77_14325 [Variovorax sp. JS1663]